MLHLARHIQQLARTQHVALAVRGDVDAPLQAMHGDVAGHRVRRQGFARCQHEAHDLQVGRLEQRDALGRFDRAAQGRDIDGLRGMGVGKGHAPKYAHIAQPRQCSWVQPHRPWAFDDTAIGNGHAALHAKPSRTRIQ
jgi:hypothetical protein